MTNEFNDASATLSPGTVHVAEDGFTTVNMTNTPKLLNPDVVERVALALNENLDGLMIMGMGDTQCKILKEGFIAFTPNAEFIIRLAKASIQRFNKERANDLSFRS